MFTPLHTSDPKSSAHTSSPPGRSDPFFQPKLTVNTPGDAHEQEADRVADQVMRMRDGDAPIVQRMPLTPVSGVQRKCTECEKEEKEQVQRKETGGQASGKTAPSIVSNVLSSGSGQHMDTSTRQFMESRFGQDFGQVRIHTGGQAAESAAAIQARAYTSGRDVVFGKGEYQPGSARGKQLLAHELVHVGQQSSGNADRMNQIQRQPSQGQDTSTDELIVGNTFDFIKEQYPVDSGQSASVNTPKAPGQQKKFGGSVEGAKEGAGKSAPGLSKDCDKWIKVSRTTYPYNPAKDADSIEVEFVTTYKDFKEGIPISKPEDFNTSLKKLTATPCTCLENLQIDGHGASWSGGGQEFAPRTHKLAKRSFGVKKDAKGKLVPYNFDIFDNITFCKPCSIKLGGCYVALNKPKAEAGSSGIEGAGDALGKALADKTGCSVTAFTDLTTTPKAGEFKGGDDGKWVTTNPEKEAAPRIPAK